MEKEQQVIEHVLDGDVEEFSYFLDTYAPQVFQVIYRLVQNKEDAEELTQDTFVNAFEHLSSFRQTSSFSTWIYRIAYNLSINALRKKGTPLLSIDSSDDDEHTLQIPDLPKAGEEYKEERIEQLQKVLSLLPADEQLLIRLYYTENKPVREIAYILHLTESNVKTKLFRVRGKLYEQMNGKNNE